MINELKLKGKNLLKLLIIDGSSILSTSFFGNLPREYYSAKTEDEKQKILKKIMHTSTGEYTNGVFTFCKILIRIINNQKPSHLAVAWDISRDTFRRKLYHGYKANRSETLPALKSQFSLMQDVLRSMNISQFKIAGKEADDILGTLAKDLSKQYQHSF